MMLTQKIKSKNINIPLKFKWLFFILVSHLFTLLFIISGQVILANDTSIKWYKTAGNALKQAPDFYNSDEALRIADIVLLYQRNNGGWPINYDHTKELTSQDKNLLLEKKGVDNAAFKNGSTHTEVRYLARVYRATGNRKYKDAFLKGLEFILRSQYDNGGWPLSYPSSIKYHRYITFNDNAMAGVMTSLQEIISNESLYSFVDPDLRARCAKAVAKGIECILKTQIEVNGKKTVWCAQYDEVLLTPEGARTFELKSLSGYESVGIVEFLMSIHDPSREIIEAIQYAVIWFNNSKIQGIRLSKTMTAQGWDRIVTNDASAPPMWARFYDINTNKPIFSSRDGVPKDSLNQISFERRNGYGWLGYYPASLLAKDYPAWQIKWAPNNNILKNEQSNE